MITPGFPPLLNKIALWMIVLSPLTKFALCTRPVRSTFFPSSPSLSLAVADVSRIPSVTAQSHPRNYPWPRRPHGRPSSKQRHQRQRWDYRDPSWDGMEEVRNRD